MFQYKQYQEAAAKVNWEKQKQMYQEGHEFTQNYHQLYADNKSNEIGEFLDLHFDRTLARKNTSKSNNSENKQLSDAIETLQMLAEDSTGKEKKELLEAIETLEMLLD